MEWMKKKTHACPFVFGPTWDRTISMVQYSTDPTGGSRWRRDVVIHTKKNNLANSVYFVVRFC